LAGRATSERQKCREARLGRDRAEAALEVARERLRLIAGAVPVQDPPKKADLESVIQAAQGAQKQMDVERAKLSDIYDVVDRTTKAALALSPGKPGAAQALGKAQLAQGLADDARRALSDAQRAANRWIEHSLQLQVCLSDPSPSACPDVLRVAAYRAAVANQGIHQSKLKDVANKLKELRTNLIHVEASERFSGDDFAREVAFRQLLQNSPDARALFGKDSYLLSASNGGGSAAIQLGWDRYEAGGVRRYSLILSTPAAGTSGRTKLYDLADGLAASTKAVFGVDLIRGGASVGGKIFTSRVALSLGRDERNYFPDAVASPAKAEKVVYPRALTIVAATFGLTDNHAQILSLSRQSTYEDGKAAIRCPAAPAGGAVFVDCVSGPIGGPGRRLSTVASYQYRAEFDESAIAPALSYNHRSRVVDLQVPIYLVRSSDSPARPFNAGVSLGWSTKGKTEITGRDSGLFAFSVFVGAPFSVFSGLDR
jgi:hypothetical protein